MTTSKDNEVHIAHLFDAPRELVFEAWTNPEHLAAWYAPDNCTARIKHMDVRVGGSFLVCINHPVAGDCWAKGVYLEIAAPSRLVFTLSLADEHGNIVDGQPGTPHANWPRDTTVTLSFEDRGSKTMLLLHQTVSEALAKQTGAHPGWIQMLHKLNNLLVNAHS
ncbi:SRPBCC family protein [Deminuibacter soli]|uniref:SRPBCC domain-containing protein n=1 Tax=Deminuibacter soli TaxID=2291815 RepID=A0A3E1NE83_9BACT|nr:SRPBCC domain-containing protein [Deminuibacter soli]RFM26279.1 SRPBCC domain-containing protein [Deminuibacter soli]